MILKIIMILNNKQETSLDKDKRHELPVFKSWLSVHNTKRHGGEKAQFHLSLLHLQNSASARCRQMEEMK